MIEFHRRIHVSLLTLPDSMASPVSGLFDVFQSVGLKDLLGEDAPSDPPFEIEIVAQNRSVVGTASGLPITPHRAIEEVDRTDIVIVPAMMVSDMEWVTGRYPEAVEWLLSMHKKGATLCSACSGVLLLAETGLLDGRDATIHWAFAPTFQRNFSRIRLRLEEVLIVAGKREEFVMAGAGASWHDLALYLVARHAGSATAQAVARFLLLQWHKDGQAPYVPFSPPIDHGDAVVGDLQEWLKAHYMVASPVEEMVHRSGLPERSFKRRFTKATGFSPIAYVQHTRIEVAKRRLERTDDSVDEIGWSVGYEDASYFRRLFKKFTHLKPSEYRKKFRVPSPSVFASDTE
ncbi:MAG: helix-turn-helix domain-containing protein [Candidatus Omnitrophica bacterium]|nr:helix-turn-helix domain-containing protein [Candidatus Omnitrophota bacterium]